MSGVSAGSAVRSTETDRTGVQDDEQLFGSILGDVAALLWPEKTAANLAAEIGCTERVAEMYIAGDRKWSGDALAIIVAEIMRRHHMRNFKVKARE